MRGQGSLGQLPVEPRDVVASAESTNEFAELSLHIIVRSSFRAKHHVVVQYIARWMKCPLPPCPLTPHPQTPLPLDPPGPLWKTRRTRKNRRHYQQRTSHCSCLEHCFLFSVSRRSDPLDSAVFARGCHCHVIAHHLNSVQVTGVLEQIYRSGMGVRLVCCTLGCLSTSIRSAVATSKRAGRRTTV